MHLANGVVTPMCAVYGAGVATIGLTAGYVAARRMNAPCPALLAAATALVFAAQTLNLPVLPGVSGHLVGGFLLAYWFGAAWGLFCIAAVLALQAVLSGDGSLPTLGLNVVNMGVIPCLIVYPLWKRFTKRSILATAAAAWMAVVIGAAACGLEIGRGAVVGQVIAIHSAIGLIDAVVMVLAIAIARDVMVRPRVVSAAIVALLLIAFVNISHAPDGLEYCLQHAALVGGGK